MAFFLILAVLLGLGVTALIVLLHVMRVLAVVFAVLVFLAHIGM